MRAKRSLASRLFSRIRLPGTFTGCWEFVGAHHQAGYGQLQRGARGEGLESAHRAMWVLAFGPIPEGKQVCHHCDNPPCVRPDHLFLSDLAGNHADKIRKGRAAKNLTPADVALIRQSPLSGAALGKLLGVARCTVNRVRSGDTWAWLRTS